MTDEINTFSGASEELREKRYDRLTEINAFIISLYQSPGKLKRQLSQELCGFFCEFCLNLADLLQNSPQRQSRTLQKLAHSTLNLARTNTLLRTVAADGLSDVWYEAVLVLITTGDYTFGALFEQRVSEYQDKPLFQYFKNGQVKSISWQQCSDYVHKIARALLTTPDTGKIAILSHNSYDMACLDIACLLTGRVNVMIPANSVSDNILFILNEAHIHTVFVQNGESLATVVSVQDSAEYLKEVIVFAKPDELGITHMVAFSEFVGRGTSVSKPQLKSAIDSTGINDLATIMYTSGTTQAPKGIVFSQKNIICKRFARAVALPEIGDKDTFLCYLPLFHTFGRYLEMVGCIFWGSIYVFMESVKVETMIENMQQVKPTVFISIPKKWLQVYQAMQGMTDLETADDEKIRQTVKHITGGRLKWGLSAAGYLDPDVFSFFQCYGVELMSGFGMTEATGGITMTPPGGYRHNSVGIRLPGIEIRLADDGEMLIRGSYVLDGYANGDRSEFQDDWLCTGDIFQKDADGYYQIIDRKKEIYKNIRGETVSPQKIENLFQDFDSIKKVFLVGDHREYNTLLIYPNYDYDQVNFKLLGPTKIREFFNSHIVSVNRFLAPYERIVDFAIIEREFSDQQGELTPKGTYRRKVIENNFMPVITHMYELNYLPLHVDGLEVRIPNWFLREKSLTSADFIVSRQSINLPRFEVRLTVRQENEPGVFRIGSALYQLQAAKIDLGELTSYPELWLGNIEFQIFIGEEIYRWSKLSRYSGHGIQNYPDSEPYVISRQIVFNFKEYLKSDTLDIRGLHLAAVLAEGKRTKLALGALNYLNKVILHANENLSIIAKQLLIRLLQTNDNTIRQQAFFELIQDNDTEAFRHQLQKFVIRRSSTLTREMIDRVADGYLSSAQLDNLFIILGRLLNSLDDHPEYTKAVFALIELLTNYGVRHPVAFSTIRAEFTRINLNGAPAEINSYVEQCLEKLQTGFRFWLGRNLHIAVNPETREEYRWEDVVTFEDDIPRAHRTKILQAIARQPIIKEAVFLFSEGALIQLHNIQTSGIWISLLRRMHNKIVYRINVQTHHHGSFDFTLNIFESQVKNIRQEQAMLIAINSGDHKTHLVNNFAGYWPEEEIWSEEFVPGETVERHLQRLVKQSDSIDNQRIHHLWPYFVWSGLTAFVDFWFRTGRKMEISDPSPDKVIVPTYDFQFGFRIVSISKQRKARNLIKMAETFRDEFIGPMESIYTFLKGVVGMDVVFSSFVEILGDTEGIRELEAAATKLKSDSKYRELLTALQDFARNVRVSGFRQKRLHFAIKRFHNWLLLNPNATPLAKIQTLQELSSTYALPDLETQYPGTRVQLFRDTVFADSGEDITGAFNQIVQKLRSGDINREQLPEQISLLRDSTHFSSEEKMFLTRMTYPHVHPRDAAELISLTTGGKPATALVIFFDDQDGNRMAIREPGNPKEIAALHRLFALANLYVEFEPEHHYLLVFNERQQVTGGLYYRYDDPEHVHLEKIVIADRYRQSGVSERLLQEFFNRLKDQGVHIITVGFLRPQFFYRFGFAIDEHYGNLVKLLREDEVAAEPSLESI